MKLSIILISLIFTSLTYAKTISYTWTKNSETTRNYGRAILPARVLVLSSERESLSEVNVKVIEEEFFEGVIRQAYSGTKCRCRENKNTQFSIEETIKKQKIEVTKLGNYQGKNIFHVVVPMAKQSGKGLSVYKKAEITFPDEFSEITYVKNDSEKNVLVLFPNEFSREISYLNEYLGDSGFNFKNINLRNIGLSTQKIQKFLKNYLSKNKVFHVILVGDEFKLPTFYRNTKFDAQTPTDLPYFTLGGQGDYIPDVLYSRIPISKPDQLKNLIDKYYSKDRALTLYQEGVLGVSSNEGSNPSDKQYMETMLKGLGDYQRFHLNQDDENSNPSTFNHILQTGVRWVGYIGHGSGYGWPSFKIPYRVSDFRDLKEMTDFPIVFDVACQNGRFDNSGRIGEVLIKSPDVFGLPRGAVSYIGGTVDISWHPPAKMGIGMTKWLGENKNGSIVDALMAGQFYLMKNHSSAQDIKDNFVWFHLQGNPFSRL